MDGEVRMAKNTSFNIRINSDAYDKLQEYCKEDMGVSQFVRELIKAELVKKNIMDIDEEI